MAEGDASDDHRDGRTDWEDLVKEAEKRREEQRIKDEAMSADELIEDFADGIMGYIDGIEEERKEYEGEDYEEPLGEEVDFETMYQSIRELTEALSKKEDAEEAIVKWCSHDRWCVSVMASGVATLLEDGTFWGLDGLTEEELEDLDYSDDFDPFIDWMSCQ